MLRCNSSGTRHGIRLFQSPFEVLDHLLGELISSGLTSPAPSALDVVQCDFLQAQRVHDQPLSLAHATRYPPVKRELPMPVLPFMPSRITAKAPVAMLPSGAR